MSPQRSDLRDADAAELALIVSTVRGTSAYVAYLIGADEVRFTLDEIRAELLSVDPATSLDEIDGEDVDEVVDKIAEAAAEVLLVNAFAFTEQEWSVVDRRRSSISHRGVCIFVTTAHSFDALMRVAPNVASWLGALVFQAPGPESTEGIRQRRLASLRDWSGQTDDDVIREASAGTLRRDPEYAEWLVLLGRGDLLPQKP